MTVFFRTRALYKDVVCVQFRESGSQRQLQRQETLIQVEQS